VTRLAAGLLLSVLAGRHLAAQSLACTFGNNGSCSIPSMSVSLTPNYVARLTLSSTSTGFAPVAADYTAGYVAAAGPTVTAKVNAAYHVTVDATTATFSYAPVGGLTNPNKPASDLTWATTVGGLYTRNAGTSATLLSGSPGTSGTAQAIFFRARLSYSVDQPGTYALTVRYTLSAP
jgi:hypothetical protein